jgi:hypothetical protein
VRHRVDYKLLIIAVCSLMALSHVCTRTNSTLCAAKKLVSSESHGCCEGSGIHACTTGILECLDAVDEHEDASEPSPANSSQEDCCKVCNSLPFLITNHALIYVSPASSALAEMYSPFPLPDFSFPIFKPPQA